LVTKGPKIPRKRIDQRGAVVVVEFDRASGLAGIGVGVLALDAEAVSCNAPPHQFALEKSVAMVIVRSPAPLSVIEVMLYEVCSVGVPAETVT
jgi:hypothetical protein